MDNRFALLIIVVAIAVLAFFALQGVQAPREPLKATDLEESVQTTATSLSPLSASTAWLVAGTSATFRHNASVENGNRVDFVKVENNGSAVNLSFLVIVPKRLAASASLVTRTGSPVVLREDPVLLYDNVHLQSHEEGGAALLIDVSRWNEGALPGVVIVPLYRFRSTGEIEALVDIFSSHSALLDGLSTAEAFEVGFRINSMVQQVASNRDFLLSVDSYLSALESPSSGFNPLEPVSIPPMETRVSLYSPANVVSFETCRLPDCSTPSGSFNPVHPLVRVEGDVAQFVNFRFVDLADTSKVKVELAVSVSSLPVIGGEIRSMQGEKIETLNGVVLVSYPSRIGSESRAPLSVKVESAVGAVKLFPSSIPSGRGGSIVYLTSDLPFSFEEVTSNCFPVSILIPGVSPIASRAVALYFTEGAASSGAVQTCKFFQNGYPLEGVEFSFSRPQSNEGYSELYPVVTSASSWRTCSDKFCTCQAAREALSLAVEKAKRDAVKYTGPRYPYREFVQSFMFNLADFGESCDFGVEFSQSTYPKPGVVQVISVKVGIGNSNEAMASAFSTPDTFIPGVVSTEGEEAPSSREVQVAAAVQWPCRDSSGLPSSQPQDACSSELRNPPVIAVATTR